MQTLEAASEPLGTSREDDLVHELTSFFVQLLIKDFYHTQAGKHNDTS